MRDGDREFELVVGGPQGIRVRSAHDFAPGIAEDAVRAHEPLRLLGAGQRWIAAYGHFGALALAVLGVVAAGLGLLLIESLGLSRFLYLPVAMIAGISWSAALGICAMQRRTRSSLSATVERELLRLAGQRPGPLTIPEAARALDRPLAEVEHALTAMSRAGHAIADVDLETGQLQFSILMHHQPLCQEPRT